MQSPQKTTRDYFNTAILGLIIGLFLIPTERNLAGKHSALFIGGIIAFPLLSLLGMFIAKKLLERFAAVFQFVKYGLTGTANTAINLGVINVFVLTTGVAKGAETIIFSVVAFIASLSNSYYWNSHWSFKSENTRTMKEFVVFGIVTLIGVILNSSIVYIITRIAPPASISPKLWINIASLTATLIVLFWNFYGFRKIVFKSSRSLPEVKA
jgi:putative flippase GtrA